MVATLRFVLDDQEALAREHAQNLRHGRALVPTVGPFERLESVTLRLERRSDGAAFELDATVVMIREDGPMAGTAVEICFAEGMKEALARFVDAPPAPSDPVADDPLPTLDLPTLDELGPATAAPDEAAGEDADDDGPEAEDDDGAEGAEAARDPKIVRIRRLSAVERMRLARDGALEDRVLLERSFGKAVWEDLLRNPGITLPEVARIANKGTAPRILLDQIADNPAWGRQSIVRRALLCNPRLSADAAGKLLRGLAKNDLKLIGVGTAYPMLVRTLAKKLLGD